MGNLAARQRRRARCAAPANNTFANVQQITGAQATLTGTNVDAANEGGKPSHAGNVGGRAVWYTRQAPSTGIATASTTGKSNFDPLLGVYPGNAVGSLTQVAINNNEDTQSNMSTTKAGSVQVEGREHLPHFGGRLQRLRGCRVR